ncbi:MAG: carbon monoxide dehydrogenase [Anaerolineales bacterium]|nr:carbon monoxide dehydrogenase [Anaerolineales bacterium]
MHLEGTVNIKASRETVWQFLTDPNKVSQCAPGVETVKARFAGDAEFLELEAPNRAKIKGHGNAPGSAVDVMSEMFLSDGPEGSTEMRWTADIVVLGQCWGNWPAWPRG